VSHLRFAIPRSGFTERPLVTPSSPTRPAAFGQANNSEEAWAALLRQIHLAQKRRVAGVTLKVLHERVALDYIEMIPRLVRPVQPLEGVTFSPRKA
jgi:hypothetical protein